MERIRRAFERNAKAVSLRPGVGQGTAVTRVRLMEGLRCQIEEGPWTLTADMGEKSGGTGAGPNPGVLGRAALGSCLAVGYAMWAAYREVPIDSLEVEIQADYDVRGELGVADVSPAYGEVRYVVTVESERSEEEIVRLLDEAETHSSYLQLFAHGVPLRRELHASTRRP